MTAIRNQRGGVRRGISIAAAALSLALVAPAIQPVVAPQFVATAVAQDASSTSQSVPETNVPANTKHSVKGYTLLQSNGALKDKEDSEYTSPISGVPVYAQWFNAYGEASPVTKGTSDAKGFFSFTLAPFVSQQDGKLQEFLANPSGPFYNKVRVWSPGNADLNAKYDIFSQWNNGKPGPNTDALNTSEGMGYNLANSTMGDFYIRFKEKTDVKAMVGDAKQAPTNGTRLGGKFAGRVYWENYLDGHVVSNWGAAGSGYYEFDKNKDAPASKIKVYAAYLSDQAIAKINSQETKTALGVTNIRGAGWTAGNERDLQNWIKKQIAKDGADKWLAESYYTETNSDGEFTIQFNGTWGSAWDTTPSIGMKDEAKERLHSVSKTSEDGDWALGLPNSKHVNTEWMFIQTEPIENATVNSPWNFGTYTGNVNAKYGITGLQTQWGVAWGRVSNASNIKIPIMSMDPQLDIVKYDSYENFAAPGDTVATKTTGIALQGESDQKYQIVWKDAAGNVIKVKDKSGNEQPLESAPLTVGSDGTLPSYPMTVPNDLAKVTTYKAYLYALAPDGSREDAQPLDVDSYTAIPLEKPVYTPKEVEQGKQGVSAAPKFDNLGTKPVETDDNPYPENSHFEIDEANLPEGVSASDVSIDKATGVVTLKEASGRPGSTINIPVKYVVEKPLLDENKKPVLRPEYKPGTGDLLPDDQRKPVIAKQVMNTVAPFTITAPTTPAPSVVPGSVVDEVPNDGTGKKLDDKVKNPTDGMSGTVTDKDGNPVKDATVTVDPSTGEITVTVPKGTTPGEGYKVQVKDKADKNVGDPIDVKVTDASTTPAPSVAPGTNDTVPNDGQGKTIDGKITGPVDGLTGKVVDSNGKAVDGAKVVIGKDGKVTVTVPDGTKPGKYVVEITDKDGNKIGELPITVVDKGTAEGSIPGLTEEQARVCVGASAASAVPLLLLTPIALGLAMDNQQVKDLTAGFGKQLEDINTGIQKTLGIYNPELAQQFKVQVAPHLQNLVLAAGFVASIALLAGVAADQCVPGGGSSDNTSSQK